MQLQDQLQQLKQQLNVPKDKFHTIIYTISQGFIKKYQHKMNRNIQQVLIDLKSVLKQFDVYSQYTLDTLNKYQSLNKLEMMVRTIIQNQSLMLNYLIQDITNAMQLKQQTDKKMNQLTNKFHDKCNNCSKNLLKGRIQNTQEQISMKFTDLFSYFYHDFDQISKLQEEARVMLHKKNLGIQGISQDVYMDKFNKMKDNMDCTIHHVTSSLDNILMFQTRLCEMQEYQNSTHKHQLTIPTNKFNPNQYVINLSKYFNKNIHKLDTKLQSIKKYFVKIKDNSTQTILTGDDCSSEKLNKIKQQLLQLQIQNKQCQIYKNSLQLQLSQAKIKNKVLQDNRVAMEKQIQKYGVKVRNLQIQLEILKRKDQYNGRIDQNKMDSLGKSMLMQSRKSGNSNNGNNKNGNDQANLILENISQNQLEYDNQNNNNNNKVNDDILSKTDQANIRQSRRNTLIQKNSLNNTLNNGKNKMTNKQQQPLLTGTNNNNNKTLRVLRKKQVSIHDDNNANSNNNTINNNNNQRILSFLSQHDNNRNSSNHDNTDCFRIVSQVCSITIVNCKQQQHNNQQSSPLNYGILLTNILQRQIYRGQQQQKIKKIQLTNLYKMYKLNRKKQKTQQQSQNYNDNSNNSILLTQQQFAMKIQNYIKTNIHEIFDNDNNNNNTNNNNKQQQKLPILNKQNRTNLSKLFTKDIKRRYQGLQEGPKRQQILTNNNNGNNGNNNNNNKNNGNSSSKLLTNRPLLNNISSNNNNNNYKNQQQYQQHMIPSSNNLLKMTKINFNKNKPLPKSRYSQILDNYQLYNLNNNNNDMSQTTDFRKYNNNLNKNNNSNLNEQLLVINLQFNQEDHRIIFGGMQHNRNNQKQKNNYNSKMCSSYSSPFLKKNHLNNQQTLNNIQIRYLKQFFTKLANIHLYDLDNYQNIKVFITKPFQFKQIREDGKDTKDMNDANDINDGKDGKQLTIGTPCKNNKNSNTKNSNSNNNQFQLPNVRSNNVRTQNSSHSNNSNNNNNNKKCPLLKNYMNWILTMHRRCTVKGDICKHLAYFMKKISKIQKNGAYQRNQIIGG